MFIFVSNQMESLKSLIKFVTNKYFLVTAFFLSWIFFFASNDLLSQWENKKEFQAMQTKLHYLETEIETMRKEQLLLTTDSVYLEKFAREHYRMKKPNEDIFVFDTLTIDSTKK
jgi:cell division protein FtsB